MKKYTSPPTKPAQARRSSRSIQSIEVGFKIVRAIEERSKMLTLGEIARAVGMPGGSVHPYLVSLSNVGLVRQDAVTSRYGLGPYAVQVGLAGIRQLDVFDAAKPILSDLCEASGLSIYLSIWGNRGPAIIQRYDGAAEAPVAVRVGWVLPVLWSAMGQVCLAYLPRRVTRSQVEDERRTHAAYGSLTDSEFEALVKHKIAITRRHGVATTESQIAEGYCAIAAPIIDHEGALLAVATALGLHGTLEPTHESPHAARLISTTQEISRSMGYRSPNG